jgi:crotonobetainyl-CoA:carnitine CoA-transferase CaiB-like acyl-CoA transferase
MITPREREARKQCTLPLKRHLDSAHIEHPVRGDTQRGFINMGGVQVDPNRHPLIEHPNRGKRSVGIDISTPPGQELLYEIAKTSDVFLTNYLPPGRRAT